MKKFAIKKVEKETTFTPGEIIRVIICSLALLSLPVLFKYCSNTAKYSEDVKNNKEIVYLLK